MSAERKTINEAELIAELEPSPAFARLVARMGTQAGVGNLGLGAIRTVVRERAVGDDPGRPEAVASKPSPPVEPASGA